MPRALPAARYAVEITADIMTDPSLAARADGITIDDVIGRLAAPYA